MISSDLHQIRTHIHCHCGLIKTENSLT
ncbi:hypothetical protein NC651_014117 [Populus alba x Populus x berolinensis]|nr:hypothetical protein NC651_014117 [Populus alba x Populus x berolinensis]